MFGSSTACFVNICSVSKSCITISPNCLRLSLSEDWSKKSQRQIQQTTALSQQKVTEVGQTPEMSTITVLKGRKDTN